MAGKKSALIVSIATFVSRIFGLIRDVVFARLFAANWLDTYLAAFQIPNLLRDMFAEGALSQAFTSTFTKLWEKEGEVSAWQLAQIIVSVILLILGGICLLGIATSYWLVLILKPGFAEPGQDWGELFLNPALADPEGKLILTMQLTQILWPFILFVSLAAMAMGMLNSRNFFGLPASASIVFNVTAVVGGVGLAYLFDPQENIWAPDFGPEAIYGVALGALLGGVGQLGIQVPLLFKIGFRFRWRAAFTDPRLMTVLKLMVPTVLAAMAVQINVLVNTGFVSFIEGGQTWYTFAFRLFQFPVGVFGVAIATVTLPAVARLKAGEDLPAFGREVEHALRFALYLTLPASVGLAVLAPQIVSIVFQGGAFGPADVAATADALRGFSLGIAGYSLIKVLIPCFIALDMPNTPFKVSCIAVGVNAVLATVFFWGLDLGVTGLAMTVSLVILINVTQLIVYMAWQAPLGNRADWVAFLSRMVLALGVLGGIAALAGWYATTFESHLLFCLVTLTGIGVAAVGYFAASLLVGLRESTELVAMVRRKLLRR
ncbi:MAG: murein biosynthesis integral membrane protein MurJ [Verrucomicrobiota bacterium]